jgi:predicted PurR-regulated permease PerM
MEIFNLHSNIGQTRGLKMSEKKMVRRSVVIALVTVCIILVVVSLVGAYAYFTPIISGKDDKISSLNSQMISLNNQILEQNYTILEKTTRFPP